MIEAPSKKEVLTILAIPSCFGTADEKKKLVIDIIVSRIDAERLFTGVKKELSKRFLALIPGLIAQMNDTTQKALNTTNTNLRPLMFVVFCPAWKESLAYQQWLENDFLTKHLKTLVCQRDPTSTKGFLLCRLL